MLNRIGCPGVEEGPGVVQEERQGMDAKTVQNFILKVIFGRISHLIKS